MKIFLTNPNGFIGRNLRARLEEVGHTVTTAFSWTHPDVDVIINTCGETEDEARMFESNVEKALEWAQGCFAKGIRFIHLGTVLENADFRHTKDRVYIATKTAATTLLQAYANRSQASCAILRLSTVYGNDDKHSAFLPTLWKCFVNNTTFNLVDAERDWIHVSDACNAILTLVNEPMAQGIFSAGSGSYIWNHTLVEKFVQAIRADVKINHLSTEWTGWKANNTALMRLGWAPKISLESGIKQFVEYKAFEGQAFLGAEA